MSNSQYDALLVHQFLVNTPESALRKMLINMHFNEVCFNFLMKVAKGSSEAEFCEHFNAESFPKIKLSAKEIAIKETFWANCVKVLNQHGLLSPAQKVAA